VVCRNPGLSLVLFSTTNRQADANPETIIIGTPLDGSTNPDDTKLGDYLGDVTGIITNAFGFYRILPLTAVATVEQSSPDFPAASFQGNGTCRTITFGSYNAENLNPQSEHLPAVATQIVEKMRLPDLIFLQEVQDDSGPDNDGVTNANETLALLAATIEEQSGVAYDYASVDPVNNEDGGQPGGNIQAAYLYRPDHVELYEPSPGPNTEEDEVLEGPIIKYNPGRIGVANPAFQASRKPLIAMWKPVHGTKKPFFTVNVHMTSKGGSSTLHGDPRPPVNEGVEKRAQQTEFTAAFIAEILAQDPKARIISAGDFNEFSQVQPQTLFVEKSGLLDLDDVVSMPVEERYTYLFDMNCQALDHMYVSPSLQEGAQYEHLHLNTWQNYDDQVSDHDPSVAKLNLCGC
jgi:predicted extracellular nuclease